MRSLPRLFLKRWLAERSLACLGLQPWVHGHAAGKERERGAAATLAACPQGLGPTLQDPECQQFTKEPPGGVWTDTGLGGTFVCD